MTPQTLEACCTRTPGERLAYLRRLAGLSIVAAAAHTGISRSELSRLENGSRRLAEKHKILISHVYGLEKSLLDQILAHDVAHPERPETRLIATYDLSAVTGKGTRNVQARRMQLPAGMVMPPSCYGIVIDTSCDVLLPKRSVVLAVPEARPILGDLVVNVVTWSPALLLLKRDDNGTLHGTREDIEVSRFHKVVAIVAG